MKLMLLWTQRVRHGLLLFMLAALTGCSSFYVDGMAKEIPVSQYQRIEPIHPVQVLFEFQTNGVTNAVATSALKMSVIEQIQASGLFSTVSEDPAPGGALLGITLNNVAVMDEAFSKGFVTGLTFGLAGSQVSDGYVCTATYSNGTDAPPIVKRARHAIHTTIGASAAPADTVKVANLDEAVTLMTRQIISNVLNDLTTDTAFK
ncbi:MAG: hypothetical protein KZQ99_22475 [Candidatus Thiodiazotropha sp. (ex Dulcina madagascariensis)]|nr:hypothetical protein [Candidatus Thiodiazotropha sp. (ex Dulcina madagascariensis)]